MNKLNLLKNIFYISNKMACFFRYSVESQAFMPIISNNLAIEQLFKIQGVTNYTHLACYKVMNELPVCKACSSFESVEENLFHGRKRSNLSFVRFQDEASIFPMSLASILEFEVRVSEEGMCSME